jgi:hypothetical protein
MFTGFLESQIHTHGHQIEVSRHLDRYMFVCCACVFSGLADEPPRLPRPFCAAHLRRLAGAPATHLSGFDGARGYGSYCPAAAAGFLNSQFSM